MKNVTVAAIQMDCVLGEKQPNLEKAAQYIKQAAGKGAELITLPELFSTGYRTEAEDRQLAEQIPGFTTEWLKDKSKTYHVYLAGAILEYDPVDEQIYDTCILTGPEGYIGKYRKTHLWDNEKERFSKGTDLPVFKTAIGTIGLQICYEIGFPEISRIMALKGAEIIVCTSAFGMPRLYAWELATQSRALENGAFLIAANRTGTDKGTTFAGHSRIVNPQGSIFATLKEEEGYVIQTLNQEEILAQRERIPYLSDHNKELYMKNL